MGRVLEGAPFFMCGIAGAFDLQGQRLFPQHRLLAMTRAIVHRGPDDESIHIEPGLAMGSRRLSIVDLQGGRQPISNENGDVWISYNGELFDYPDLFYALRSKGHRFKTRCDTELWVHLYEDHGDRMLERVKGQFAFALWDRTQRRLLLGRDRVGICPLYTAQADGWLLWASEIKALLASGMIEARPDPRGIDHVLTFFAAGTSRTCFEDIRSIAPGHYLDVRDGQVARRRYWDLDFPDAGDEQRWDDASVPIHELERRLRYAIERRLRGDVPVVSYISGGLDSTIVLGMSSDERGHAVPSFTIGLDRAGPDERVQAAETAAMLDSKLTTIEMGVHDIADAYPELTLAAESPVIDTSTACLMRLAQTVHDQGFKVALTGEGADEALAGYVWFRTQKLGNMFGTWFPRMAHRFNLAWIGGGDAHRPPFCAMNGVRTVQQDVAEMLGQTRETLYTRAMWDRLNGGSAYDDLDLTNDRIARWHPLNQSLYAGYKIMLPGLLMMAKGDRIAMNASVETRYPFLDEDVIEFCAGIDPRYKLRGLTDKWILRRVAASVLPKPIARRRKTMFRATRSGTFLGEHRPAWVDQLLSDESLRRSGWFDPEAVARARRLVARPLITPARSFFDLALTGVISTQLWHHLFCGGRLADLPTWSPPVPEQVEA
jgi:asparagine synthase (glutamine-hydrolysing)